MKSISKFVKFKSPGSFKVMKPIKPIKSFKAKPIKERAVSQKRAIARINKQGLDSKQIKVMQDYWSKMQSSGPAEAISFIKEKIAKGEISTQQAMKSQALRLANTPASALLKRRLRDIATGKQRSINSTTVKVGGQSYPLPKVLKDPALSKAYAEQLKLTKSQQTQSGITAAIISAASPILALQNEESAKLSEAILEMMST